MTIRPNIIVVGNDPNCIHHEYINAALVGTCYKCDQVRDYGKIKLDQKPEYETSKASAGGKKGGRISRRGATVNA